MVVVDDNNLDDGNVDVDGNVVVDVVNINRHLRYGSQRCNAYKKQPDANACIVNIKQAIVSINKFIGNHAIIGTVNNDNNDKLEKNKKNFKFNLFETDIT